MGQTLSSETLSISGGDGYRYWVGLTMKPSEVGCKKTVYKGVLLGHGPRQWEKVVAKAFTQIPGTKESWKHELNKADVTKQLVAKFEHERQPIFAIRIVIPGIVQMDRVSNVNKRLAAKDDGRGLTKDEWISVEELIPGKMGRYCPWSNKHIKDLVESKHMQAFSHFTYKITNGELVACDFQGIYNPSSSQYIFTDSSIHSTFKLYGFFDQGDYGISEFFKLHKCNEICNGWPKPTPLTPPPSFESACMLQSNLTPASAFENIIFPAFNSENAAHEYEQTRDVCDRRRHQSERQRPLPRLGADHRIVQSVDFQDEPRQLNIGFEREPTIRDNVRGQDNPPPPNENVENSSLPPLYDSLVLPRGNNGYPKPPHYDSLVQPERKSSYPKPPHYDSLVQSGDNSSNHNLAINSRCPFQYTLQSGSQMELSNDREASNSWKFRHRSATDPLLHLENTANTDDSGACPVDCIQIQGSQLCSKCNSSPSFCCGEATPASLVPSAPPDEGDDISGT